MKDYIKIDEWKIIEEGFDPHVHKVSESIFSLGNGRMGQRANFEEAYSGESLLGNYVAGVYYPDKTRVGWWKNGYPEYFAKVLNAANWVGIDVQLDGEQLDLAKCEVSEFRRELNMKDGYLKRNFTAKTASGKIVEVEAIRFCSMADDETGAIKYSIKPINFSGELTITPSIDGDVKNQDSNYDEKFWDEVSKEAKQDGGYVQMRTKKTGFEVATGMKFNLTLDGNAAEIIAEPIDKEKYVGTVVKLKAGEGQTVTLYKYAANLSSQNHPSDQLAELTYAVLDKISAKGFDTMMAEQAEAWAKKWELNDIIIDGDVSAQQAIRFNIFQLNQTYTGEDDRLNIGPKGFTGEKYGGSTYWDTEAYCVPFYLSTAEQRVTRNLLLYRYKQLGKAIENAALLGFKNGAALYPMVTMDGTECHNEWEITFEEIHRNGAIAFAIYNYVRYTGDEAYLADYGLEVLLAIARFWSQRVNWSEDKQQYVMLGVTGPNEYENNINNNWYTSTLAVWCMEYALEVIEKVKSIDNAKYEALVAKINFDIITEGERFKHIIANMYLPYDEKQQIFLQQDGYLDKEQILVKDLPATDRPINQKWSWDRILRSCYIKQADVLQGIYFFEDQYDIDTIKRNFDYYEPRTVHESSLSPCVHSILAAKLGDEKRAYEFYLRTSRLDLDDYNNDTEDGCHITSMAGTWMSVVEGFGGMRMREDKLSFQPFLPEKWASFSFHIGFRGITIKVTVSKDGVKVQNLSDQNIDLLVYGKEQTVAGGAEGIFAN
ncbi:glycoside hydrolase family 65 protein [Mucilaginibacter myungsuensis]|uniref:Glycoside hydrolase family 65 protein n=1 Tax=Mucilaginibacter myungsuensis TaxID=649104 RepID=A0A929KV49_9SPHI|nr:glycoside hydrolase family 65 protein [Mucilaginibacter myungsuensis]MBE9660458.1 glycoside hydrolase family 65 protein [Mucilaginibacter myungsuensis]MDN3600500.1 glycoside hydrolase family 65 protein [Mucilaginibacter myungsuensis]